MVINPNGKQYGANIFNYDQRPAKKELHNHIVSKMRNDYWYARWSQQTSSDHSIIGASVASICGPEVIPHLDLFVNHLGLPRQSRVYIVEKDWQTFKRICKRVTNSNYQNVTHTVDLEYRRLLTCSFQDSKVVLVFGDMCDFVEIKTEHFYTKRNYIGYWDLDLSGELKNAVDVAIGSITAEHSYKQPYINITFAAHQHTDKTTKDIHLLRLFNDICSKFKVLNIWARNYTGAGTHARESKLSAPMTSLLLVCMKEDTHSRIQEKDRLLPPVKTPKELLAQFKELVGATY